MITARSLRSRMTRTVSGMSMPDITIAVLLGLFVIGVGSGAIGVQDPGISAASTVGVLLMVAPVAWRRPLPLTAAAVALAATVASWVLFPPLVRCGVALPAIFLIAYSVAARCDGPRSAVGLALCVADVIAEGMSDPRIEAAGLELILPVLIACFVAGRLVRSRTQLGEALRGRSAELREQREQTARLAVLADRARVNADLEDTLHVQLDGIATTAASGLDAMDTDPAAVRRALAAIEHDGRQVLGQLREVLGTLEEQPPSEPQPTLSRLSDLLSRATTGDTRLTVAGNPRVLPAGLELSGYRIVEHLLLALEDAPSAVIDVRLNFGPDTIELHVSGPPSRRADLRAVLAAARERAALHGGTVDSQLAGGVCHAMATLPLISGHA
jgi:Histidine kinase